jgi:hypothetical protein
LKLPALVKFVTLVSPIFTWVLPLPTVAVSFPFRLAVPETTGGFTIRRRKVTSIWVTGLAWS